MSVMLPSVGLHEALLATGTCPNGATLVTFRSDVLSVGVDSGFEHGRLTERQRLNHFPRHMELTRKDLMVKNMKKWKRQMVKAGKTTSEFWPTTFRLPEVWRPPDCASFRAAHRSSRA